jgi:hypothetical protein
VTVLFQLLLHGGTLLELASGLSWFVIHGLPAVLQTLHDFMFDTVNPVVPTAPFTTVAAIQRFTPLVQAAADSGLTLVVVWAAYRIMWARVTVRSQYVLRVLLPRLFLAAILINLSLPLIQAGVDASNALCDAVQLATGRQVLADATIFVRDLTTPGLQALTMLVLFAAYVVLAFVYVIRFTLLVVLTILSPAAALLFVLPETRHYAHEWGSLFVSALLMQPLQLLVLAIGFGLDASSPLPTQHVFALASVFIAFKVPGALHSSSAVGSRSFSFVRRHVKQVIKRLRRA